MIGVRIIEAQLYPAICTSLVLFMRKVTVTPCVIVSVLVLSEADAEADVMTLTDIVSMESTSSKASSQSQFSSQVNELHCINPSGTR